MSREGKIGAGARPEGGRGLGTLIEGKDVTHWAKSKGTGPSCSWPPIFSSLERPGLGERPALSGRRGRSAARTWANRCAGVVRSLRENCSRSSACC